jgi:hypothetical protein
MQYLGPASNYSKRSFLILTFKALAAEPYYMMGPNPTEPASILSRIQKPYSSIRHYKLHKNLTAGKLIDPYFEEKALNYFLQRSEAQQPETHTKGSCLGS